MSPPAKWTLDISNASQNQFKKFNSTHPKEYTSLFTNLQKILKLLNEGHKVGGFHVNFFRSEGDGVYRIGQTAVKGAQESRLYLYPDSDAHVLHVLEIGEKSGQQNDIRNAKAKALNIRQQNSSASPPVEPST